MSMLHTNLSHLYSEMLHLLRCPYQTPFPYHAYSQIQSHTHISLKSPLRITATEKFVIYINIKNKIIKSKIKYQILIKY